MPALKDDRAGIHVLRHLCLLLILEYLERAALQDVDDIVPVLGEVDGELRVHRILILVPDRLEDVPHLAHDDLLFHEPLAGDEFELPLPAQLPEGPFRLVVVLQEETLQIVGHEGFDLLQGDLLQLARAAVDHLQPLLGILALLRAVPGSRDLRPVQADQPGIGTLRPIHRRGPQAHHQAQHPRRRVQTLQETVRAVGISHPRGAGHIVIPVVGAGDPLHQQGHLLVPGLQAPPAPVVQGGSAHGAGIHRADRVLKLLQPLLQISGVGAEDRFVFPGEGVPEAVLQDGAGADDDRVLPVVFQQLDEFLLHLPGEFPGAQPFGEFIRQGEELLLRSLADPEVPEPVFHNEGVKHVRADEEGVVGLEVGEDIRPSVFHDLPCQEHARCLAADHPGPQHALFDIQIVLRTEVLFDHDPEALVPGHHDVTHAAALLRHIHAVLMHGLSQVEEAVPAVHVPPVRAGGILLQELVEMAGGDPVQDRLEIACPRVVPMGEEHGFGVAVPDLVRADVDLGLVRVHVQKQLGGIPDLGDGLEGMLPPDQREKGHRIQGKQIGAGYLEEVPHHQVRRPGCLQLREAVEHIEGVVALLPDDLMDRHRKGLEPVGELHVHDLDPRPLLKKRRVRGEADVDQIPSVPDRLLRIRLDKKAEILQTVHPPDHVVSQTDIVEAFVHLRDPGRNSVKRCHIDLLLCCSGKTKKDREPPSGLPCPQTQYSTHPFRCTQVSEIPADIFRGRGEDCIPAHGRLDLPAAEDLY